MHDKEYCPNCKYKLKPVYKYCPECGQKNNEDLTLAILFNNTISNYFSVDARFFKSFVPLIFKPGWLPREFVGGKRLTYLHPAQMYLFISVVFFFMFSFIARDSVNSFDEAVKTGMDDIGSDLEVGKIDSTKIAEIQTALKDNRKILNISEEDSETIDSLVVAFKNENTLNVESDFDLAYLDTLIAAGANNAELKQAMGVSPEDSWIKQKFSEQFIKFYRTKSGGTFLQAFFDSIPIAMFLLLPVFALLLKVFYYKTGRYAHHLVFTFYFFAFIFSIFSLELILSQIFENLPWWISFVFNISILIYLFVAIKTFYRKGWLNSFIKTSLISLLSIFPLVLLTLSLILVAFFTY